LPLQLICCAAMATSGGDGSDAGIPGFDEMRWKDIWAKVVAKFAEEAGEAPGAGASHLEVWELALLARMLGETLHASSTTAVGNGRRAARSGSKSAEAAARKVLHRLANSPAGSPSLEACERHLRRVASDIWNTQAAESACKEAEKCEQTGDIEGACSAYKRALDLGTPTPLEVSMRYAHPLCVRQPGHASAPEACLCKALGIEVGCSPSASSKAAKAPLSEKRRATLARLVLLYCHEGREEEALPLLQLGGWKYRLAPWLLRYSKEASSDGQPSCTSQLQQGDNILPLRIFDQALPGGMATHLQHMFGPESSFWQEHNYNEVRGSGESGYFSYLHKLDEPAKSTIDIIARQLLTVAKDQFPGLAEAKFAEWWAHCRPHPCGHQLHYDSDNEGIGGARHPICSLVYFVEAPNGVGGPTLVTNQRLGDDSFASQGWLVYPKQGRLAVYDGSVLHGVLPGYGVQPEGLAPGARRVTFMVAFWREITMRPFGPDGLAGSSRPLPDLAAPFTKGGRTYTWHQRLAPRGDEDSTWASEAAAPSLVPPFAVPVVWVEVENAGKPMEGDKVPLPDYGDCFQF